MENSKKYSAKSSLVRFMKKSCGSEFLEEFTIHNEDGLWWAQAKPAPAPAPAPASSASLRGKSTVANACSMVWEIAAQAYQEDPKAKRKEILAQCVAAGIAYYTARTQLQRYKAALRDQAYCSKALLKCAAATAS